MQIPLLRTLPLILLLGCDNRGASDSPLSPTSSAPSSSPRVAASAAQQNTPVSLAGHTFRLKSFPIAGTGGEAPQFRLYLYSDQQPDSVLVGVDTEPSVLDLDQGARMGVPKTAVLLFQTYYAGAGYQYYVRPQGNQLSVYYKRLEEASPATEGAARPQWQLFKTFEFFTQGTRQLTP